MNEVLHCDKPGNVLKNAPQAFSMKLKSISRGNCGLKPTPFYDEFELLHDSKGVLVLIAVMHVDDLKMAGSQQTIT